MNSLTKWIMGSLTFSLLGTLALAQGPATGLWVDKKEPDPPPPQYKLLKIYPQAAPTPALMYRLDPDILKQESGNAVQNYYRAYSPEWASFRYRDKDYWKKEEEWLNLPIDKLPQEADKRNSRYLWEIERGTNRSYADWDMIPGIKRDGIGFLLPDIQGMREFARDLTLRTRYELKEKDYPAAIKSMRTTITLGRHVAKGVTLIQGLVGIAITTIGFKQVEDGIQQPGFPNLYWALAALPSAPIDLREAMDGEKFLMESITPGLRDILYSKKPKAVGQPELQAMVEKFREAMTLTGNNGRGRTDMENLMDMVGLSVTMAASFPAAKEKLLKFGWEPKALDALPPLQVVLMCEVLIYDETYDSILKWLNVPYWQAKADLEKTIQAGKLKEGPFLSPLTLGVLARLLLPATSKVLEAKVRNQRHLAQLMVVEAIRMHAAQTGKLPQTLEEIKVVPIPVNPVTGKAFSYKNEGTFAMLESEKISDADPKEYHRFRLELVTPAKK